MYLQKIILQNKVMSELSFETHILNLHVYNSKCFCLLIFYKCFSDSHGENKYFIEVSTPTLGKEGKYKLLIFEGVYRYLTFYHCNRMELEKGRTLLLNLKIHVRVEKGHEQSLQTFPHKHLVLDFHIICILI